MQASIHGEGAFDKPGSSIIPRNVFLATPWKTEPIANFFFFFEKGLLVPQRRDHAVYFNGSFMSGMAYLSDSLLFLFAKKMSEFRVCQ